MIEILFIASMPILAIALAIYHTAGEKVLMRVFKVLGVLISSMPIIGIIQGFVAKNRSPSYSKACFTQAIYCGLGFVLIQQVLPLYT